MEEPMNTQVDNYIKKMKNKKENISLTPEQLEADAKKKEQSLSDKRSHSYSCGWWYPEEDVKHHVKRLKEFEASKTLGGNETDMILISLEDLHKIFGSKLI